MFMAIRTPFFKYTGFNYLYLPIFEYLYLSARMTWIMAPVFVLSFALNLSMKFNQIKERLETTELTQMTKQFWSEIRDHYVIVCNMVEKSSEFLSVFIMLTAFFDFSFLCERLYRQFSEEYDAFGRFHLTLVLTFIFCRCVTFILICANVNQSAYEPLQVLRKVPDGNLSDDVSSYSIYSVIGNS